MMYRKRKTLAPQQVMFFLEIKEQGQTITCQKFYSNHQKVAISAPEKSLY